MLEINEAKGREQQIKQKAYFDHLCLSNYHIITINVEIKPYLKISPGIFKILESCIICRRYTFKV